MACERVDISVLIVDDDEISLAILANILIAWKIKVLTAKGAPDALNTLREFEGFFDLIISEFHVLGMSGFEFQKRVKDEFQLPIIMMSADNRKNVISKSMEYGAALYILKPFCADDFKNIWHYAIEERKKNAIFDDVSFTATSSLSDPKSKKNYCKRKNRSENQSDDEGRFVVLKKPKMIWTTYLHNLFMLAIKQLGMDKAVPKKILAIMNVPGLTRENVASHLQKYRIFLRKVIQIGMIDGLSHRALRSKFALGIPMSVIQGIQSTRNAFKPIINQVPTPHVNQLGRVDQFNDLLQNQHGGNPLNQVRLGQSSFGSNIETNNGITKNMSGSFSNPSYEGGHGLMTSAACLTGDLKYADPLYQNYGSMGNHKSNHGLGNWNNGSLSSSNIQPQPNTHHPQVNSYGIQLSDVLKMVGTVEKEGFNNVVGINGATTNNNSFAFINGTENANMNVGLVQERFGFAFGSDARGGNVNELPTTLITTENKNQYNTNNILNEMDETRLISESMNSDQVVQLLEQMRGDDEFQNGELYDWLMGDNVASTSTFSSTTDQEKWDMDLIEALFGTQKN